MTISLSIPTVFPIIITQDKILQANDLITKYGYSQREKKLYQSRLMYIMTLTLFKLQIIN